MSRRRPGPLDSCVACSASLEVAITTEQCRLGVRSCKTILKINESKVVDTMLGSSVLDKSAWDFPSFSDFLI